MNHQETINELVNRLIESNNYFKVTQNFNYRKEMRGGWVYGEIDVLAFKIVRGRKYVCIFEIKTKDNDRNYFKALSQLARASEMFEKYDYRVFKFYKTPKRIKWMY